MTAAVIAVVLVTEAVVLVEWNFGSRGGDSGGGDFSGCDGSGPSDGGDGNGYDGHITITLGKLGNKVSISFRKQTLKFAAFP